MPSMPRRALELKRAQNLLQHAETQLKQPGLQPAQIATLTERFVALRKEYLDLRTRFQDIPPLPDP